MANDHITNGGGFLVLPKPPDHLRFLGAGVIGDFQSAKELYHLGAVLEILGPGGLMKKVDDTPSLEFAHGTSSHYAYLITYITVVVLVMDVNSGLPLDFFSIQWVWNFIIDGNLHGFVSSVTGYHAD